jgi:hypothetical protein
VSGVLSILAASATPSIYSVSVVGLSGSVQNLGYNPASSPGGSISSTAFKSTTINNISTQTVASGDPTDIQIVLDGSLAQSYFSALVVQRTDGEVRRYATADATSFSVFGGGTLTFWEWDNSDPAWTEAGTRFLMLFP